MYKPSKKLGQNFLADRKVLDRIIEVANISKDDTVLEIGPGQGSLTYALCQKAGKVIAVEKDEGLFDYLENKFSNINNLELVNKDILEFLSSEFRIQNYKIVANIPYYLTSFLLRKIFSLESKPLEMILMVQKEVAERICSKYGEMNLLAISVQMFAEPEILFYVSKNSFWPKPKVDSAVIKLKVHLVKSSLREFNRVNEEKFFDLVKAGFSSKRKLLANNLHDKLGVSKNDIYDIFKEINLNVKARAQDLNIKDWQNLYKRFDEK